MLLVLGEFVVSAFKDGRLAGGRRADGTLPKLCIPSLRGTWFFCAVGSADSPRLFLYIRFISSAENLGLAFRSPLLPPLVFMLPVDPH